LEGLLTKDPAARLCWPDLGDHPVWGDAGLFDTPSWEDTLTGESYTPPRGPFPRQTAFEAMCQHRGAQAQDQPGQPQQPGGHVDAAEAPPVTRTSGEHARASPLTVVTPAPEAGEAAVRTSLHLADEQSPTASRSHLGDAASSDDGNAEAGDEAYAAVRSSAAMAPPGPRRTSSGVGASVPPPPDNDDDDATGHFEHMFAPLPPGALVSQSPLTVSHTARDAGAGDEEHGQQGIRSSARRSLGPGLGLPPLPYVE
jgi:hypothetical protein